MPQRTAEEISTATTEIIVVEDAAPEAGRTPLQTERSSPRTRVRREETRLTSGNETTTKKGHAAGVNTADHPPGLDAAVVHHPHGIMNQGTSPKRGGMKSNEKSRAMERRGGALPAVGDVLGTGKVLCSGIGLDIRRSAAGDRAYSGIRAFQLISG